MQAGYIILGFVIGGVVAGGGSWVMLGAVGGAIIGGLLGRLIQAERRVDALESRLQGLEFERTRASGVRSAAAPAAPVAHGHLPGSDEPPGPGLEHGPDRDPEALRRRGADQSAEVAGGYGPKQGPGASTADAPIADEAGTDEAWPPGHTQPGHRAPGRSRPPTREASPTRSSGPGALTEDSTAVAGAGVSAHRAAAHGAPASRAADSPSSGRPPSRPSLLETGLKRAAHWFTTGNVPVKVGVILSFIGVSFLLKYAIDRQMLSVPIEFRLLGVAAGAVVMLVVGWRLRTRMAVYALSLQGGGAGILFLTIFAAFRIWGLLPAPLAFALLVVLAAGTGALAVLQSSRTLIVLGATGGFLAPVLASTGQGSHVALFSYYLVLNATILGVAWFRAWRGLNLLGFFFTFVIGSLWGYRYYRPDLFASTEPFLVLYFLFYNAIALLYAVRRAPSRVGVVDGTLVFGTPVIAFGLQAALMRGSEYGLAISAAVLALFYIAVAVVLFRRVAEPQRGYLRTLTESFIALAVAFATLAIPLALDARWTSAAWALEGAALVWVGTRQGRHLAALAGATLMFFSGIAFFEHGWRYREGWPVLNANVIGGVLIALSSLFAARRLEALKLPLAERIPILRHLYPLLAIALFGWGALWWLGTGAAEIGERARSSREPHLLLLFFAASAWATAWIGQRLDWSKARRLSVLYLPGLLLMALLYQVSRPHHFLHGFGWLAWPAAFAVQAWVLVRLDAAGSRIAGAWHAGSVLLATGLLGLEAAWQTDQALAGDWDGAAASVLPGLVALLILRLRHRPAWPVPAHPMTYRGTAGVLVAAQVVFLAGLSIDQPGDPAPLAYLPVLNPFDLALLFAALVTWIAVGFARRESDRITDGPLAAWMRPWQVLLGLGFFVLTTAALVRGVHHVAEVRWDGDALFRSERVQTALSIYWGLLGFCGMVVGARRSLRLVWLAGAGFMALVVLKLFLIDLGNSGTVERIVSFIGIGVLLLVVGYFAPVPPRRPDGDGSGETPADEPPPDPTPPEERSA
ncbi:DUF2339 domain-containing protein [Elongatibacter sediminis]|uniref:DUF2339 domain-containing protein n=1 Tax=Elongatibacter sediminis TaxID=3119006 RepID=A0AAW9REJ6_9GAMM